MLIDLLKLAFGLTMLVVGGDTLVRGASSLASRFGVSPVVIGLTVVAFGTSAPELAVNLQAALGGNGDLSFGNIMGSNLANLGLIVGCAALVRPLLIHAIVVRREIPMMLVATVAAAVMAADPLLLDSDTSVYSRGDGIALLLLFAVFLTYTARDVFKERSTAKMMEGMQEGVERTDFGIPASLGLTIGGMAALIFGGRTTVDAAETIAVALGASDAVIGLTVVAIGTSLPELVTALVATYRGQTDIAVGNVVGSNLFNLLFVFATTVTLAPVGLPEGGIEDLAAVLVISLLVCVFAATGGRRISRPEGAILLVGYFAYTAWRAFG